MSAVDFKERALSWNLKTCVKSYMYVQTWGQHNAENGCIFVQLSEYVCGLYDTWFNHLVLPVPLPRMLGSNTHPKPFVYNTRFQCRYPRYLVLSKISLDKLVNIPINLSRVLVNWRIIIPQNLYLGLTMLSTWDVLIYHAVENPCTNKVSRGHGW